MAKVIWLAVFFIGSALGQSYPGSQYEQPEYTNSAPLFLADPTCSSDYPLPYPDYIPDAGESAPNGPEPAPCSCATEQTMMDSDQIQNTIQLRPCNSGSPQVNYLYGQAPCGTVIIIPGEIRFPRPEPIIIKPGAIKLPTPPPIWVKPAPVKPPQLASMRVQPPPIQPPTPQSITVQPKPVTPPRPELILVRPPPITPPKIPKIKITPPPVQPPPSDMLVVQAPRILVSQPPTLCYKPLPPKFNICGSVQISAYKPPSAHPR